ncbi:MAG: ATP-binding protein [Candidatus Cloacimonetes bacterium]|nr:ATP-binding protein [Candidatus Cloacimonadota bacterium]
MRTPLNSIIGFTGILLQELPGPINDEQRKQLSIVQSSSRHLLSLINDVLDISKIEAGQLELKYSEILPQKSLAKLQDLMSTQIDNKGLVLEMNCDHNSGTIITDERRFEQIMLNLLSNAVKFTEKGKISVECERGWAPSDSMVKDTGIGIPEDQFDKLFLPFRQIDSGLTRKYEGSGLGTFDLKKLAS